jgi:hypothetical protein
MGSVPIRLPALRGGSVVTRRAVATLVVSNQGHRERAVTALAPRCLLNSKTAARLSFAAHTNAAENKSQEVALNAPVSAGHHAVAEQEQRFGSQELLRGMETHLSR